MKKITIILALVFFFLGISNLAKSQCKQQLVYTCASATGGAIYLRDFNTKLKKATSEEDSGTKWTVVLNKGTHYRFNICTPEDFEDKVVLTLYDSQNPEKTKPYASTWDRTANTDITEFDFVCQKSGMYYVSIRFKDEDEDKKTCAVGILSFVGKNK